MASLPFRVGKPNNQLTTLKPLFSKYDFMTTLTISQGVNCEA